LDEEVPDDLETSDRYLVVPHKTDLDLGRSLALRFAGSELRDCHDQVLAFFRRRGAYARFKNLLESKGALQRWYKYEAESTEKALKDWCVENGIRIIERDEDSAAQHTAARTRASGLLPIARADERRRSLLCRERIPDLQFM